MTPHAPLYTFAAEVLAQTEAAPGGAPDASAEQPRGFGDTVVSFIGPILMFAVIYMLLIRPASKQRKEHANMLGALKKDDEVVTTGGIVGKITAIDDKLATLEVGSGVKIRVLRDRIAGRYTTGAPASK